MSAETAAIVPGGGLPLGRMNRRTLAGVISGLAVPVVLANLSQTLMGLVDTLMVGRLGTEPLAAVGIATLLFSALAMSLKQADVATQTITAHRVGAGRDDEVGSVLATAIALTGMASLVLMAAGMLWPDFLMRLVNTDDRVRELGVQYLRYRYAGMLPLMVFFMTKAVTDGIGWTRVSMTVGIGMNLGNVLLNWILIFGKLGAPAMGVAGAALASTLCATGAALSLLAYLLRPRIRHRFAVFQRGNFQPRLLKPFVALGWPPAVQSLGAILALLVFFFILGRISTLAVATGNVVLRISALSFMPGVGVGAALQTLVGQSLGRGDPQGARRSARFGVVLGILFMGSFGLVFLAVPEFLLRLFSDSREMVTAGIPVLRLTGLVQVIDAVGLALAGALRGAGETRVVMLVDICSGFLLLPPLAYLFGVVWGGGLLGAWWALLAWFSLYAVGMIILFNRLHWQEARL